MVSSHLRSVACRQKETGSYYYMKLDDYDMVTLCSSTESRIGERRLLFELDLDGRYYNEILWFLPARDRWLANRRRREVTTTWNWMDMIWLLSAHRQSRGQARGSYYLNWIWKDDNIMSDGGYYKGKCDRKLLWVGWLIFDNTVTLTRYYHGEEQ